MVLGYLSCKHLFILHIHGFRPYFCILQMYFDTSLVRKLIVIDPPCYTLLKLLLISSYVVFNSHIPLRLTFSPKLYFCILMYEYYCYFEEFITILVGKTLVLIFYWGWLGSQNYSLHIDVWKWSWIWTI